MADSAAELVAAVRSEIADIISDTMPDVNLVGKFVRQCVMAGKMPVPFGYIALFILQNNQ